MNEKKISVLVTLIVTALLSSGCSDDQDDYYRNQVLSPQSQQQNNNPEVQGYTQDGRPIIINQQPQQSGVGDMVTGMAIGAGAAMLYNNYQDGRERDRDYDSNRRSAGYYGGNLAGSNTATTSAATAATMNRSTIPNNSSVVTPSAQTPKSSSWFGSSTSSSPTRTGSVISRGSSFGSGSLGA